MTRVWLPLVLLLLSPGARAEEEAPLEEPAMETVSEPVTPPVPAPQGKAVSGAPADGRSKTLEFDDNMVEGMRKSKGEFTAVATKERRGKNASLYNRSVLTRERITEAVKETGYEQ